jgi:hypothetical protein
MGSKMMKKRREEEHEGQRKRLEYGEAARRDEGEET